MLSKLSKINKIYQKMSFNYYPDIDFLIKDSLILSDNDEFDRYNNHNNFDASYEKYQHKIYNEIKGYLNGSILDFGCGKNPYLAKLMNSDYFDLYFYNKEIFTYDCIVMIEVIEHIHCIDEIKNIIKHLNNNGNLVIKTQLITDKIDLKTWWYLRDNTHYQFFSIKTFEFLCKELNLELIYTNNVDLVVIKKLF